MAILGSKFNGTAKLSATHCHDASFCKTANVAREQELTICKVQAFVKSWTLCLQLLCNNNTLNICWNEIKHFINLCIEKFLTDRTTLLSPQKNVKIIRQWKNAVLQKCNFSFAPIHSRSFFCATAIDHFFTMHSERCIWIFFFSKKCFMHDNDMHNSLPASAEFFS